MNFSKLSWIKNSLMDGLSAMALGLFSTLIVGIIVKTIGEQFISFDFFSQIGEQLVFIGVKAMSLTGPAIAVSVALALKAPQLVVFSNVAVGLYGYLYGGPVGAYVASIISIQVGKIVHKKMVPDIIITPLFVMISGYISAITIGKLVGLLMTGLGLIISEATIAHPIIMGAVIAVIMGMALTAPISSAALAIMLGLNGLAAGAATVGCCTQMIGFSMMGRKTNSLENSIAVGLGTSMLQIKNIVLHPWIWIPTILTSAILGPFSTTLFKMTNIAEGAGMGTSALVGPLLTITSMGLSTDTLLKIVILYFVLPVIFVEIITKILIIKKKITYNDLQLSIDE